jgi:transposase-like protein
MARQVRDPQREAFWREAVKRCAASGLSGRAFCRQEQLAEHSFYAWRRTIAKRDARLASSPGSQPLKSPLFVPAVVRDAPLSESAISLELHSGRVLRLPASTSIERLVQLVQALEGGGSR